MATAPAPTYQFLNINYNHDFFISNPTGYVTYAYVNANFLKSIGVALSTAISTTFTGNVTIGGLLTLSGGLNLTGGLTVDTLQVNSTSSFIGQSTFTLVPILPTGYQFLTTLSQTITGIKTFSSTLNTNGISDLVSISSPIITASTVCNAPYFNATNSSFTTALYNTSITGTLTSTVSCSSGYFQATGATTSSFNNISATGIFNNQMFLSSSDLTFYQQFVAYPTTTIAQSGMSLGWNANGIGETDFINLSQLGTGGFNFSNISSTTTNTLYAQIGSFTNNGLRIFSACGQIRLDDYNGGLFNTNIYNNAGKTVISSKGISTSLYLQCGDGSANPINTLSLSSSSVSPLVNLNPTSTTTFNTFHPTTTLGNNISTNTTQYSTVGYVNSLLSSNNSWTGTNTYNSNIPTTTLTPSTSTQFATVGYVTSTIPTSLLGLNNTWTGNNNFYGSNRYINIGTSSNPLAFGASTGNSGSIIIGDSSSLVGTTPLAGNICISPPLSSSLYNAIGSNNICIGASSCTSLSTGSNNVICGASSCTSITTGSYNTVIGCGSWNTGNFSSCTVIGFSASNPTASNQIILGNTTETVIINGASQINNTLMTGTTVVSNNIQVNGNITQPILTFTTGVATTFTTIPPYILYLPAAGQAFVLPIPSASNAGQTFTIRRTGVGSSSTVIFGCTGSPAVWVILNANTGGTNYAVASLGASQSMWFSSGTLFYQLI